MTDALTIARARMLVEDSLSEKRRIHVFAVAEEIHRLCQVFELTDQEPQLFLAALLHDITKEKSLAAQLQLCAEYGIILRAEDTKTPKGLHAISAAEFARREFSLSEPFCEAIRYHTTGRENMTLYDKLLFLADYIEKTRTWGPCKALRRVFWKKIRLCADAEERRSALDYAVRLGIDSTLQDLIEEEKFIHPDTLAARNSLLTSAVQH